MAKKQEVTEDTKTLITVLLLVFAYPIGLVMMFIWTKWPKWVKILLLLPFVFGILISLLMVGLAFSLISKGSDNMENVEYKYMMNSDGAESSSSGDYTIEK